MIAVRLSVFYGSVFAVVGVQLPFWPVFLAGRGLTAAEIGVLLAVPLMVKLVANPLAGIAADRLGSRRSLMAALGAGSLVAYSGFLAADGFWALCLVTLTAAAVFSPLLPLGENLAVRTSYEQGLDYGRIRLWGSVAFILAALLSGEVLDRRGADGALHLVLAFVVVTLLCCPFLPETRAAPAPMAPWTLFRLTGLVPMLLAATFVQASHSAYYVAGTLHWRGQGHSTSAIALLWAEGVVAEIILFWFGAPLVRFLGPAGLIAVGGAAGVFRWAGMGLAQSLTEIALLQALHALTFGAVHLGAMHFLQRAVPSALSATGQGLYSTLTGIGFGLGMAGAGAFYQTAPWLAWLAAASLAAGGAVTALWARSRAIPQIAS